jgi:hypothetical protein
MNTEIKIIKYSKSHDEITYKLYVDDLLVEQFNTYEDAFASSEKRIIALQSGYPKIETVFEQTVEHLKI